MYFPARSRPSPPTDPFWQASNLDRRFFTHNGVASYQEDAKRNYRSNFGLEDIKGAAATVLIAGNDTASPP
jgi:hypothetical protein